MYDMPSDFTGDSLVGTQIASVLFAENVISIDCDGVILTAMSRVRYRRSQNHEFVEECPPVASSELMALVGFAVEAVEVTQRNVKLLLSEGAVFELVADEDFYENFTIAGKGIDIVV